MAVNLTAKLLEASGCALGNCSTRYAGQGVAFDCLGSIMKVPLVKQYTVAFIRRGMVTCNDTPTSSVFWTGVIVFALLLVLHAALIIAPAVVAALLYSHEGARAGNKSMGVIMCSMAILSVASLGETTQHIQDNWIYFGLTPSYNNAVFYGFLTFGQALLAWGIGGLDVHIVLDLVCAGLGSFVHVCGIVLAHRVPDDLAYLPFNQWGVSTWRMEGTSYSFFWVMIVQFLMLGVTTSGFLIKANRAASQVGLTVLTCLAYLFGVFASIVLECTGFQGLHVFVAFCFVAGFAFQAKFLFNMPDIHQE